MKPLLNILHLLAVLLACAWWPWIFMWTLCGIIALRLSLSGTRVPDLTTSDAFSALVWTMVIFACHRYASTTGARRKDRWPPT